MAPQSEQSRTTDEEAASVGIEVVPVEKLRCPLDTEESSSSLETGHSTVTPHSARKAPNSRKSRMTRREWILAGVGVIALIGLAVGLGVALAPSGKDTSPTSATTLPPQKESPFPETKAYIDSICSSFNDTSLCEDVCAPAECCTTSGRKSCLSEYADSCLAYAKCHGVVEIEILAPPAPLNLPEICARDNLTDCSEACHDAKCCFEEDMESCQATHLLTCLDYAPCQVLNTRSRLRPADTSSLIEMCSLSGDETIPSEECMGACRGASCCWADGDDSCLQTNFMECMTYSPCNEFDFRKPNNMVDPPTANIERVCSVDSVLTQEGYAKCQAQCNEGWCCNAAREPYNCFAEDPFGCLYYQQCEILPLAGGSVPRAPFNLTDICNIDDLDAGALENCIETCKPAACCVVEGDENCYNDGNALACDEYEICKPVHTLSSGNLESPPNALAVCTKENVSTEAGYKMCASICEPAACCNSLGPDNCLLENIATCGEWNIGGCYLLSSTLIGRRDEP